MRDIEKLPYDPEQKVLHKVDEVDIPLWKSSWGDSANHKNVFSEDDIEWLTDQMYRHHEFRRVKQNGTLHFKSNINAIKEKFWNKFLSYIPEIEDTDDWKGNFFLTSTPYNLHIDTGNPDEYKNPYPGKQIIIPIFVCWTGSDTKPLSGTALMKQRFTMYGTNFAKSDKKYDTNVNYTVRDYSNLTAYDKYGAVSNNWDQSFDTETREKYFTHFNKRWLDGFELEAVHDWERGNMIVFDRCQAHSGVDFVKAGVTLKAGLTLMTTRKKP